MQRNAGHGAKYYETVKLILVASLMLPYELDRKHSINDYLLATEHNKTLFTQVLFTELKMSHCSVSWALVSEYYNVHQRVIDEVTFNGQRYSVDLPWKAGHGPIPSNYNSSLVRLKSQISKLHATPDVLEQYNAIIMEQLES